MKILSKVDLDNLSIEEYAERIDNFFQEDCELSKKDKKRHPIIEEYLQKTSFIAKKILKSKNFQILDTKTQRNALSFYYRSVFQQHLCSIYLEQSKEKHNEKVDSPYIQMCFAASKQSQIISARIAFECIMEFISLVEDKKILREVKKSKMKPFIDLCIRSQKFGWILFYVIIIKHFDNTYRTAEIHGTSKIATEAFLCNVRKYNNGEFIANNAMSNIWLNIALALNEEEMNWTISCPHDFIKPFGMIKSYWENDNLKEYWEKYNPDNGSVQKSVSASCSS